MIQFNDNSIKWDGKTTQGKEANEGTYFYVVDYTNQLGEKKQEHGYLQLVRN